MLLTKNKISIIFTGLLMLSAVSTGAHAAKGQRSREQQLIVDYISNDADRIYNQTTLSANALIEMIDLTPSLTAGQAEALRYLFSSSMPIDYNAGTVARMIIRNANITADHGRVLSVIMNEGRDGNDFNEKMVLIPLLQTNNIDADKLIGIFRNARYNNGLDDTFEFLKALEE